MTVDKILNDRKITHGSFTDNSRVSQGLKAIIRQELDPSANTVHREALEAICLKISRICQNPNFKDHWDDIAGYATLASKKCE